MSDQPAVDPGVVTVLHRKQVFAVSARKPRHKEIAIMIETAVKQE